GGGRLGVAGLRWDRARLDERVARAGDVAGPPQRFGEAEQQVATRDVVIGRERERALEVIGRFLVRQALERLLTGALRILDRLGGVASRGRVVVRECAEVVVEARAANVFDRARDS